MQVREKGIQNESGKRSNTFPVKENIRQIVIAEGTFLNKIHLLVFYTL